MAPFPLAPGCGAGLDGQEARLGWEWLTVRTSVECSSGPGIRLSQGSSSSLHGDGLAAMTHDMHHLQEERASTQQLPGLERRGGRTNQSPPRLSDPLTHATLLMLEDPDFILQGSSCLPFLSSLVLSEPILAGLSGEASPTLPRLTQGPISASVTLPAPKHGTTGLSCLSRCTPVILLYLSLLPLSWHLICD